MHECNTLSDGDLVSIAWRISAVEVASVAGLGPDGIGGGLGTAARMDADNRQDAIATILVANTSRPGMAVPLSSRAGRLRGLTRAETGR
jgi:hypothetical protein